MIKHIHAALKITTFLESLAFNALLYMIFSNSLIIHQVKTKKITTMKEVWIPGLNKHIF